MKRSIFLAGAITYLGFYPGLAKSDTSRKVSSKSARPTIAFVNENMKSKECQEFLRYSTEDLHTYGLVVLKGGEKQLELYDHGASAGNIFKLWSASKTFTALLLGTEIQKGNLNLETKVSRIFPKIPHAPDLYPEFRDRLRVRHLWTFSSGLDWCETDACDASPAMRLYYGGARRDAVGFTLGRAILHPPGTFYRYSSGDVTLLSGILKKIHTPAEYELLPATNIFNPLSIDRWVMEKDGQGVFLSAANLFLATNDFAKLGQLILQKGEWREPGKERAASLFSKSYFERMITPSYAIRSADTPDNVRKDEGPTGGLIWMNGNAGGQTPLLRTAPADTIYTCGYLGQYLLVFPSAGLVVARNGADTNFSEALDIFADKAVRCLAPDQWHEAASRPNVESKASITEFLSTVHTLQQENLTARIIAQEYCDCLFVEKFSDMKTCEERLPQEDFKKYFPATTSVDWEKKSVHVKTKFNDPTHFLLGSPEYEAEASYSGIEHDGCHLK